MKQVIESNKVSAILRKVLEKLHAKNLVGSQLIAMSLVFGVVAMPIHAFDYANTKPQFVDGTVFVPVTTESSYQYPVVSPIGISQIFGRFHPGIDIRAPRGTRIVAIEAGTVIEASYTKAGYGKFVRILHEGNVITISAHMDTMTVKAGEKIVRGQQIGTIGMTGWTTGPHLHFEMSQDGKYIDPLTVVR